MTFSKEMLETKEKLEKIGHRVMTPSNTELVAAGNHNNDDLETDLKHCIENDILRTHFKRIEKNEAILILNYEKNNVQGYIGTSTLMEIGVAHYLNKKIFLLNEPPDSTEQRWAHEIRIIQPTILNNDFSKIK